jgi:hypothetical protein
MIGLSLVILGVSMLFFGASLFSYSGPKLNPVIDKVGLFSFFLWLPTIIVGIVFLYRKN